MIFIRKNMLTIFLAVGLLALSVCSLFVGVIDLQLSALLAGEFE